MSDKKYDPDERARQKIASREADEAALKSGEISPEEMQHINGGGGLFRKSKLVRRPKDPAGDI